LNTRTGKKTIHNEVDLQYKKDCQFNVSAIIIIIRRNQQTLECSSSGCQEGSLECWNQTRRKCLLFLPPFLIPSTAFDLLLPVLTWYGSRRHTIKTSSVDSKAISATAKLAAFIRNHWNGPFAWTTLSLSLL